MAGVNRGLPVAESTGLVASRLRAASSLALVFLPCSHSLQQQQPSLGQGVS